MRIWAFSDLVFQVIPAREHIALRYCHALVVLLRPNQQSTWGILDIYIRIKVATLPSPPSRYYADR